MDSIIPIYQDVKPTAKAPPRGTLADLLASIIAALAGATALGYSVLFFTRFLENDTHLWGIISAFILCFGVGAFGFVPAALTAFIGFRAHKKGTVFKETLWALFLILPWLGLSFILVFISDLAKIYAISLFATTALLTIWAGISILRLR